MDICGRPGAETGFRLHDSNPGKITMKAGGVGRNIAHNLRLLGLDVSMITAFGDDEFYPFLRDNLAELGIDCSESVFAGRDESDADAVKTVNAADAEKNAGAATSVYLYILDGEGDMCVAVSDMDVVSLITPEHIKTRLDYVNSFDAVVIDANLTGETIEFICGHCRVPVYADPVSVTKAGKLRSVLPYLRTLKPNRLEAELLTGETEPAEAVAALRRLGVERPFVSAGAGGIYGIEDC